MTPNPLPGWQRPKDFSPPPPPSKRTALLWAGGGLALMLLIGTAVATAPPKTTTPAAQTSTAAATSAAPTVAASSTPRSSSTPTPVKSSSKTTGDQVAALADKTLKESLGVKSYTETCGTVNWACAITGMTADSSGTMLTVSVQETLTAADAKKTALYVWNFIGKSLPDLRWVIVRDATGTDRGQMQRSEVPMLR